MTKQELQQLIGHNLMQQRLSQNITREQLSERIGISTTFYANPECGNKMMSLVTLRKLADALCVSTDVLLYGADTSGHIHSYEYPTAAANSAAGRPAGGHGSRHRDDPKHTFRARAKGSTAYGFERPLSCLSA